MARRGADLPLRREGGRSTQYKGSSVWVWSLFRVKVLIFIVKALKHFDYRRLVVFISLKGSYVVSPFVQDCRAAGWSGLSDSRGELMAKDIVGRRI